MGSTGSGTQLQSIQYNPQWAYQIDNNTDTNDLAKNPIPFVGVGEDMRLAQLFEDGTTQTEYKSNVDIDISKLQTLQPFVLKSGVQNYQSWDNSERPYVVQYEGKYYVIDGNHRAAIAKLGNEKQIKVDISVRVKK